MPDQILDNHDELLNRMIDSISKVFSVDVPNETFTMPRSDNPKPIDINPANVEPSPPNYEPVIKY